MKMNDKKIRVFLYAAILLLPVLCLTGCSKYISKYKAIGFVHSNTPGSSFMSFFEFDGTMVFKLNNKKGADGEVSYSAKLETGDAAVFYDSGKGKTELFSLHSGDETGSVLPLSENGTVYIIIQTDGKCQNGDLHFDVR